MNQPHGRNGYKINSIALLQLKNPIIGTGDWQDHQFHNFINDIGDGLESGSIVLVREGKKPLALVEVIDSEIIRDKDLSERFGHKVYRRVRILDWYDGDMPFPQYQKTLERLHNSNTPSFKFIDRWYRKIIAKMKNEDTLKLLKYKKQIILQGPPGTGKTRLAKILAASLIGKAQHKLDGSDQYEIVQFHSGYSYEDFVRGITAKPDDSGAGIIYEPEDKVLSILAGRALNNYRKSQADDDGDPLQYFDGFVDHIINSIDEEKGNYYQLTDNIYIFQVDDNRFKYKGDNWMRHSNGLNMNFSELKKIIQNNLKDRQQIVNDKSLKSLTRSHASYYDKIIQKFRAFVEVTGQNHNAPKEELKNYVLIIDEINRANLSSVLGELIYALEYRGEGVNCMYGDEPLILPPNLYIIGTMNTADRSTAPIDYAIRRRFAFVSVLPRDLSDDQSLIFHTRLFQEVAGLFQNENAPSEYLSGEFNYEDVQLGHSYFIAPTDNHGTMEMVLEHEIKPQLRHYVKDGILTSAALEKIEALKC